MSSYLTRDGDMLDAICKVVLGGEAQVAVVLDLNPHLADLGPIYPAGVTIILPAPPPVDTTTATPTRPVRLWGST